MMMIDEVRGKQIIHKMRKRLTKTLSCFLSLKIKNLKKPCPLFAISVFNWPSIQSEISFQYQFDGGSFSHSLCPPSLPSICIPYPTQNIHTCSRGVLPSLQCVQKRFCINHHTYNFYFSGVCKDLFICSLYWQTKLTSMLHLHHGFF